MRTILFRGKLTDGKGWAYGDLLHDGSKIYLTNLIGAARNYHEVHPETIGQYTGILDKDGSSIYEGDLIHRHMGVYWRVVFKGGKYIAESLHEAGLWLDFYEFSEAKVIGNIHDNPELL